MYHISELHQLEDMVGGGVGTCMELEMLSLSLSISCRFLVPRMFRKEV